MIGITYGNQLARIVVTGNFITAKRQVCKRYLRLCTIVIKSSCFDIILGKDVGMLTFGSNWITTDISNF